jgi:hypothetical protein
LDFFPSAININNSEFLEELEKLDNYLSKKLMRNEPKIIKKHNDFLQEIIN